MGSQGIWLSIHLQQLQYNAVTKNRAGTSKRAHCVLDSVSLSAKNKCDLNLIYMKLYSSQREKSIFIHIYMYAHTYMYIYTYKHLHIYTHIYFINITYIFPPHSTMIKTVKTLESSDPYSLLYR